MILKLITLLCAVTYSEAVLAPSVYGYGSYPYGGYGSYPYGGYPAQPALATQQQNTIRSPYNLGQISTFSKTIDTPYSSVSKADVRVSNPGLALPAYHGIAAPVSAYHGIAPALSAAAYHPGVAAPVVSHLGVAAPVAKVATAGGLLGVAYSAAPAVSHMTYSNGLGLTYAW